MQCLHFEFCHLPFVDARATQRRSPLNRTMSLVMV